MKRITLITLVIIVVLALAACGSEESPVQAQKKNVPSDSLIMKDLEESLHTENAYGTLAGAETVKSLSGEGSYEITLKVKVETKYANWTYEADMIYRKYDQGWINDKVEWRQGEYSLKSTLDADALCDYFSNYLHENELATLNTEKYEISYDEPVNNLTQIRFSWVTEYPLKHGFDEVGYWTNWSYDPSIDNWTICADINSTETITKPNTNVDFSGEWYFIDTIRYVKLSDIPIILTDFSWEGFYAQIPGLLSSTYFTPTEEKPYRVATGYADIIYSDGDNKFLTFVFNESHTDIFYFDDERIVYAVGTVAAPNAIAIVLDNLPDLE